MNPRAKEALLWGVVGLLTFLVLIQGYEILQNVRVDLPVKVGAAIVVALASTAVTYVTNGRTLDESAGEEPAGADADVGAERGDADADAERGDADQDRS